MELSYPCAEGEQWIPQQQGVDVSRERPAQMEAVLQDAAGAMTCREAATLFFLPFPTAEAPDVSTSP